MSVRKGFRLLAPLLFSLAVAPLAACGDGASDLYGKWDQPEFGLTIELTKDSFTNMGITVPVASYKQQDGKFIMMTKQMGGEIGLAVYLNDKKQLCMDNPIAGKVCFNRKS